MRISFPESMKATPVFGSSARCGRGMTLREHSNFSPTSSVVQLCQSSRQNITSSALIQRLWLFPIKLTEKTVSLGSWKTSGWQGIPGRSNKSNRALSAPVFLAKSFSTKKKWKAWIRQIILLLAWVHLSCSTILAVLKENWSMKLLNSKRSSEIFAYVTLILPGDWLCWLNQFGLSFTFT